MYHELQWCDTRKWFCFNKHVVCWPELEGVMGRDVGWVTSEAHVNIAPLLICGWLRSNCTAAGSHIILAPLERIWVTHLKFNKCFEGLYFWYILDSLMLMIEVMICRYTQTWRKPDGHLEAWRSVVFPPAFIRGAPSPAGGADVGSARRPRSSCSSGEVHSVDHYPALPS